VRRAEQLRRQQYVLRSKQLRRIQYMRWYEQLRGQQYLCRAEQLRGQQHMRRPEYLRGLQYVLDEYDMHRIRRRRGLRNAPAFYGRFRAVAAARRRIGRFRFATG
jgi:hypothetical protein